ncbi:sugar ABC transporter permease [Halanaerobium sp. Z-7514]|uniref:Sugar ABC transporter permease n=1 Tax=Halanaerobium polyolivorans TaxID=2886943 RepID=A0AAW4X1G8_9FIRM|nr:sugar ABC transporter permease [Halanaerobium polyolivorans]MCC3145604.1 sugar ABC transporter permease [Halanaerobium polyolivorans]
MKINDLSERQLGYILIAPALIFIFGIAIFPVFRTIWISLHNIDLRIIHLGTPFVGLDNYIAIFQEARFWNALKNTLFFSFTSVSLEMFLGFGAALLVNRKFKGRSIVRASVLIPWAIPTVISGLIWRLLYNDQIGVINDIFLRLGFISESVSWIGNSSTAMWSVIVADVWKTTPFVTLLILAGLQTIPKELYESAKIDGANKWQEFINITLPLLKSSILVALLFRILAAFKVFGLIDVLTSGGPSNSTESLSLYAHRLLFRNLNFGEGSVVSVMTFLGVLLISFIFVKIFNVDLSRK